MIEPQEVLKVAFGPDTIWIAVDGSRPYVAVKPLCENLSIAYPTQWARIHLRHDLLRAKDVTARLEGEEVRLQALPLENLSWWLLTLRPRSKQVRDHVDRYKKDLTYHLFYFWFRFAKQGYVSPKDYAAHLRTLRFQTAPPPPEQTARRHVTLEVVERMKVLHDEGRSLREIGNVVGFSTSTISQCLRGLYPVDLK